MGDNGVRAKDLTGMKFGQLTVIALDNIDAYKRYYRCLCTCGKTKIINGNYLISPTRPTVSCGCLAIKTRNDSAINLDGKSFGFWTVLSFSHADKRRNRYWRCQCVCGYLKNVAYQSLTRGLSISCGCKTIETRENTNMTHFGNKYGFQNKKIMEKARKTLFKKWGVKHPMKSVVIKNRIKTTNMGRYGVEYISQVSTFKEKAKETCLLKYGVDHPQKCPQISLLGLKTSNRSTILKHWYSGEDIICVGSYERKVVEYFNINQIDYLWQVQTFAMPPDKIGQIRTYRPDCYLPDKKK